MKTIEEKAKAHAGKAIIECKQSDVPFDLTQSAALGMYVRDAYLAGATEALAGQWQKYPDEDFPDRGSEYIVLTESGDLCAVNKYVKKEEVRQYTNIIAWMPIVRPKDESE